MLNQIEPKLLFETGHFVTSGQGTLINNASFIYFLLFTLGAIKDYRYHDFPNTEFSYFLTIDTRQ